MTSLVACFLLILGCPAGAHVPDSTLSAGNQIALAELHVPLRIPASSNLGTNEANQWILIPPWLGGVWQANCEIVLEAYDYRQKRHPFETPAKIKLKRISQIGVQSDRQGGIWHYTGVPYRRTIDTGSFVDYQQIDKISLIKSNPNEVTVQTVATVTRMDKQTSDILSIFKESSTTTYTPLDNNLIQVTFDVTDFNMQGNPIFASKDVCIEKRTKPFQVINEDERGDLSGKFRSFLIDNEMNDLLPTR